MFIKYLIAEIVLYYKSKEMNILFNQIYSSWKTIFQQYGTFMQQENMEKESPEYFLLHFEYSNPKAHMIHVYQTILSIGNNRLFEKAKKK